MADQYLIANGVAPTTGKFVKVVTSATLATMLQVKLGDNLTSLAKIIEWGVSLDGSAAATPFMVELIAVDVAATITAHAVTGIQRVSPNITVPTNNFPFAFGATNETGFTSSAEGTPTAGRLLDAPIQLPPTHAFVIKFPLGQEPFFNVADFMRIRIWGDAVVAASCHVKIEI